MKKTPAGNADRLIFIQGGETMENPGWRALAAAIIKQAYRDHAWNFFQSAWCDELLDYVGIGMTGRDVLRMVQGGKDDGKR